MSQLSDDIIQYLTDSNLLSGYGFQWGQWDESYADPQSRYVAIIPNGGASAKPWFREPRYSIYLIGGRKESFMGDVASVGEVANSLIEYIRDNISSDCHAFIEAVNEPIGPTFTEEQRPVFQINVRTFTKR